MPYLKLILRYVVNMQRPKHLYMPTLQKYTFYFGVFTFWLLLIISVLIPTGVVFQNKISVDGVNFIQVHKIYYVFIFYSIWSAVFFYKINPLFIKMIKFYSSSPFTAFFKLAKIFIYGVGIWYIILSLVLIPLFALSYDYENIILNIGLALLFYLLIIALQTIIQVTISLLFSNYNKLTPLIYSIAVFVMMTFIYKETTSFVDLHFIYSFIFQLSLYVTTSFLLGIVLIYFQIRK